MKTIYLWGILLLAGGNYVYSQQLPYSSDNQKKETIECKSKGSYLTVSVGANSSALDYDLSSLGEKGGRTNALGYRLDVRYSYYFHSHWGITGGAEFAYYGSTGKLQGSLAADRFYDLGKHTDDDWQAAPKEYQLRARITHLEEKQHLYLFEIPLLLSYQTYFNRDGSCWGLYGGVGAKLLLPLYSNYRVQKNEGSQLNVSGYYADLPADMGAPGQPPVPQHGYGTIDNPSKSLDWKGKNKLKTGIAATAELGVMFSLGEGTDLMIGGFVDYGLTDMKKKKKQDLLTAPSVYHPGADNAVGSGIRYNGMLNSDITGKFRPLAFGGKIALKFKL